MAFVNSSEDPISDFWKIYFKYLGTSDTSSNYRPLVNIAKYYPHNKSLQEEFVRLFSHDLNWTLVAMPFAHGELHPLARELPNMKLVKVWRDFRRNGVDVEHTPITDPGASDLPEKIDIVNPVPIKNYGDLYNPEQTNNTAQMNNNYNLMFPTIPSPHNVVDATLRKINFPFAMWCAFCRNNNALDLNSLTHTVRDLKGNVLCPVLRSYICPICFETGDNAHTLRYCPKKSYLRNLNVERRQKRQKKKLEAQEKKALSPEDGNTTTQEHDENESQECDDNNLQEHFDIPIIFPEVESARCPDSERYGAESAEEEPLAFDPLEPRAKSAMSYFSEIRDDYEH